MTRPDAVGARLWTDRGPAWLAHVRLALPGLLLLAGGPLVSLGAETNRTEATVTNSMEFVQRGIGAYRSGNRSNAIYFFTQAIALNPTNVVAYYNRGRIHDVEGRSTNAMADLTSLLRINPQHLGARQLRGALHLRSGELTEALADYDEYLKLMPNAEPNHWQRGIAYFLLGRYEDGRRQFALCNGKDTNDVEHALWHFLCIAKLNGPGQARTMLLKVGQDRRTILRDVYALYAGKAEPEDVLKAVERETDRATPPEQRRFLAEYYLGQYYEALGDVRQSIEHLSNAAAIKSSDALMADVARVQIRLRRKELQQ